MPGISAKSVGRYEEETCTIAPIAAAATSYTTTIVPSCKSVFAGRTSNTSFSFCSMRRWCYRSWWWQFWRRVGAITTASLNVNMESSDPWYSYWSAAFLPSSSSSWPSCSSESHRACVMAATATESMISYSACIKTPKGRIRSMLAIQTKSYFVCTTLEASPMCFCG